MISDGFYKCGKCGFYQPAMKYCVLKQIQVETDQICDNYCQETYICDNCHNIIVRNPLFWTREDGEVKVLCQRCFQRM